MVKILGTPYHRGNSDVISSVEYTDTLKSAGLAVKAEGEKMALYEGTGELIGVSGALMKVVKWGDLNREGLTVYVQAAEGDAVTVGNPAYVTAKGKFSGNESGNKKTTALIASEVTDCLDPVTGEKVKGFAIDFVGGLKVLESGE